MENLSTCAHTHGFLHKPVLLTLKLLGVIRQLDVETAAPESWAARVAGMPTRHFARVRLRIVAPAALVTVQVRHADGRSVGKLALPAQAYMPIRSRGRRE